MEELLARERAAEKNVQHFLKNPDEPIVKLLAAFEDYRTACEALIFADFEHAAAKTGARLWQVHTDGKRYFHKALSPLRKQPDDQPVAMRQLIKLYLLFLKDSQRFYRRYIHRLNLTFDGIPELEAVAHQVKKDDAGESSQSSTSPELRKLVLNACHETLVYLGDLSRYRASEKLDKNPDFGPAIGYYSLACTLLPSSGLGHHQQAVIALDQRQHLRAIYHLYRAIVVEEPHPNAAPNLTREFDRTNAAWERGELLPKATPNDPEFAKRTLIGWFVRLHSMCFKGEPFRGYDELEREVLGQLAAELKHRPLNASLLRMVMTNLAAQYYASEKFQENPIQQHQDAFLHFFRFNIKTFTTLLRVFHDNLKSLDLNDITDGDDELNLAARLTDTARRILPAIRLYSAWLLPITHLLEGLSSDDLLKDAIEQFWPIYAKAVDLVAAVFPIWDLDDIEVFYMLEEDAETLGFKPLESDKTNKIWLNSGTGVRKARPSDMGVQRVSEDEEMLARVKGFLVDGLYLANDDDSAPLKLQATRILHRDAQDVEILPMPVFAKKAAAAPAVAAPAVRKPLSYAAAAANGNIRGPSLKAKPNGPSSVSTTTQDDQMMRMVDDLVDDGDTPPQAAHNKSARRDMPYSAQAWNLRPQPAYASKQKPIGTGPSVQRTPPPSIRTPKTHKPNPSIDRLQSVSSLWDNDFTSPQSSQFPAGLPTGTLGSPAQFNGRGHSRVNSASSIRSRTSQTVQPGIGDSWSSIDSGPHQRAALPNGIAAGFGMETPARFGAETTGVVSPLLFGAGGGVWGASPAPGHGYRNISPPGMHGQGG